MPHLHFIVNPAAGGNTCLHKFHILEEALNRSGADYSVVYSEYAGHAGELTRQALVAGRDMVVAVGGDGTAREVAQELIHTGVPMGVIPCGTGNDLSRALHIPGDPALALKMLLSGVPSLIDVAKVNDRVFLNVSGLGFDVDVLLKTTHYKNKFRGRIAYLFGVLHALAGMRGHRVRIITEDGSFVEEVLMIAVGNGTHIGGGMMVTPFARADDGLLDVCVVRMVGRIRVLYCLSRFMKGKHVELDFVKYFRVRRIAVDGDDGVAVQLDGEIIERLPATYRVVPRALLLVTGLKPA